MTSTRPLPRFLLLYGGLFAAFGVAAPFLPALLKQDGLDSNAIGLVLAGGSVVRLVSGPLGGRWADRVTRPSRVLAGFAAAAAVIATLYAPARGLALLLCVSVAHASVLAPLTPVADALTLGSAQGSAEGARGGGRGFPYGWVRGAGSAAFIAGTLLSGQLVGEHGLGMIVWLNAGLLAVAAAGALTVPDKMAGSAAHAATGHARGAWRTLFQIPVFAPLMATAALIGGSHALHDSFEVIRWRSAGLSTVQVSMLWSLSVASEVVVFFVLGRRILDWLGPSRAMMLSACAGVVRWSAAAVTAAFPVMAVVEPLHGLTFALLHLACMDIIGLVVPKPLAATAQAFYGTIALGASAAAITLLSGPLYGGFGPRAFWTMAGFACLPCRSPAPSRQPSAAPAR